MKTISKVKPTSPAALEGAAVVEKKKKSWRYAVFLSYQGKDYYGMQVRIASNTPRKSPGLLGSKGISNYRGTAFMRHATLRDHRRGGGEETK